MTATNRMIPPQTRYMKPPLSNSITLMPNPFTRTEYEMESERGETDFPGAVFLVHYDFKIVLYVVIVFVPAVDVK